MRLAASLLVVLALAACGDVGTAERLSARETLDGIDVPTIGTVGDFPDPAHRTVVNVTADGRVEIDGAQYADVRNLIRELERRGASTLGDVIEGTNPPRRFCGPAVVRVDGETPWGVAYWVVGACLEASRQPICFAVRHDGEGGEGALQLGFPLPAESTQGSLILRPPLEQVIDVFPGDQPDDPRSLSLALIEAWSAPHECRNSAFLRIDPRTPTRIALVMLDAVKRAGAEFVGATYHGFPPNDSRAFRTECDRLRLPSASVSVRLNGRPIGRSATASPVSRGAGAVATPTFEFLSDDRSDLYPLPPGYFSK